ncbi:hypothetical protein IEQ34_019021 [Dendrobium chrysotoxum]|uniref:Uncharacterized protein n=1 Tax=Dendrobium chrysotoxum TaxID=161865 RepID=A0AAV7G672_DENCH|nr:hypothetical protein IEQ34_019021 [Dendrobium chrysotoxum]
MLELIQRIKQIQLGRKFSWDHVSVTCIFLLSIRRTFSNLAISLPQFSNCRLMALIWTGRGFIAKWSITIRGQGMRRNKTDPKARQPLLQQLVWIPSLNRGTTHLLQDDGDTLLGHPQLSLDG